ncbi:MAG: TlpA family protein disulfide reductase [Candidatus Rifleibacteriota bacterium]
MFKNKKIYLTLFIITLGLFIQGCTQNSEKDTNQSSSQTTNQDGAQASVKSSAKSAPEISAKKWFNTDSFSLADNSDKIVVVEFWATWCPPCRTSIPHLKELSETYKDKNVIIVSLSNEPASTIESFMEKVEMPWIIGAGSNSGQDYKVSGIPAAFIVKNGKIVWNGHPMAGLDKELEKIVNES